MKATRARSGKPRTQPSRDTYVEAAGSSNALARIRQAASRNKKERFTSLWHHVYDVERLRDAYFGLKRKAAPGVDGVTWQEYGSNLVDNLQDLSARLARGAYRAQPVERTYLAKPEGGQRPLGKPVLEDKIVQRAMAQVLTPIYEADFLGFSYGFRPKRNPHQAVDALTAGLLTQRVNWVLDLDIRGYYDAISHEWLSRFVEHRIGDRRVLRHIQKMLKAGVMEDGEWTCSEEGAPQGASLSPLLSNIYLHYAFDLWADQWRRTQADGDVIIVRFADDIVVGFQHREEAERFWRELAQRLAQFELELHPEKTRLLEFGRYASEHRRRRGEGDPESFDFLGFTWVCAQDPKHRFRVRRLTSRKRMRRKLHEVKQEMWARMHWPVPESAKWIASVLRGHYQYYGVEGNLYSLRTFRHHVVGLWLKTLRRRSQKHRVTWARVSRWRRRWLPEARITHPFPDLRLYVRT